MDTLESLAADERSARILLSVLSEPGDPTTGRILSSVGAVETIRTLAGDSAVPGRDKTEGEVWRRKLSAHADPKAMAKTMERIERAGFETLIPGEAGFPHGFTDLGNRTPYVLWVKGAATLLNEHPSNRFTLTGSRAATAYGEHITADLASDLASHEKTVVSGGAFGIDGMAHRAALGAGGRTIAILASGLDRFYPSAHATMLERIGDVGLLVSELPPGSSPTKWRFIARARLEAALSGTTVIVEAGARSGALLVATEALQLGRAVGAVPGPVTSAASTGTHRLIREGMAHLVANSADVRALTSTISQPHHAGPQLDPFAREHSLFSPARGIGR